ncbi:MAG: TonB-dependent receptor [Hyphomonadaceae bacterium]|nr:TonB-dependent receptor [Hyphomonadaceae bacterium]
MRQNTAYLVLAAGLACLLPGAASAEPAHTLDAPITVWGARDREIGRAYSASEGEVHFGRFADRPLLRVGEIAEVVPGLAATQHSGTGKANQYFLRGFNLDHGTDFSIALDGMPLNLRTHAHGQGYLDINGLVPEIVESIRYTKGPYAAETGDFSTAGHAGFRTFPAAPESFAQLEIGEDNWLRGLGVASFGERGYAALDLTSDDGPWVHAENLEKISAFARLNAGPLSFTFGAYDASWDATDQAPLRAIADGSISRLDSIDDTVGGKTERFFANVLYADEGGLAGNLYVQRYKLNLWSNFTYFLDDPVNGDQFEQAEERWIYGGTATKAFTARGAWTPRLGGEFRYDDIGTVGLYHTLARTRLQTVREDAVEQLSGALWAELDGDFGRTRISLGLRGDAMSVDIASDNPANSGDADDAILSPKASVSFLLADNLEAYASLASGFHSNDARGATISVDPATGDPADRVPLLVRADGAELGLRFERTGFTASASLWGLDLDSELVYVGDAGATEASDASRRYGLEVLATWSPSDWLTLDGAAAWTHARFRGVASGLDHIPLAPEYTLSGGATLRFADAWTSTLTLRRIGPAPLIEDSSVKSEPSTVVNGRVAYSVGRITLALEGLNLFDSEDADITYFYASRLPGEPADGVEDIHLHPLPPRSFRAQARVRF